jgi:hypothetical protein
MSLRDWQSVEISEFGGPWTRQDPPSVPPTRALAATNIEYSAGQIITRRGFETFASLGESVSSMYNWVQGPQGAIPTGNALSYINPTSATCKLLPNVANAGLVETLFNQSQMVNAIQTQAGVSLFTAPIKADGSSAGQARVTRVRVAEINTDKAFYGPLTNTFTVAEDAEVSDQVTAGTRRFAYRVLTRNGFLGRLCPADLDGNALPVTFSTQGGFAYDITFPSTYWPVEASRVYMYMTTADNLQAYYEIPGANFAVPGGMSFGFTLEVDISDDTLAARSTPLDLAAISSLMTMDSAGFGPFNPFYVAELGNRMGYLYTDPFGNDTAAISEPDDHQYIPADTNLLFLPGFRKMTAMVKLNQVIYVFGPNWTYATSDPGTSPVEWPLLDLVDANIGTPAPKGISRNPSQGWVWVAHPNGLYLFPGGQYPDRPISYYVAEWGTINWDALDQIEVVDYPFDQIVVVRCATGTDTVANKLFVFNYAQGKDPEVVHFSVWPATNGAVTAIETVRDPDTKAQALMIFDNVSEAVLRQMQRSEDDWWKDAGVGYESRYKHAFLPAKGTMPGQVCYHHGAQVRVTGSNTLQITAYTMDNARSYPCAPVHLDTEPGIDVLRRFELKNEGASVEFSSDGGWFQISHMKQYFSPWLSHR